MRMIHHFFFDDDNEIWFSLQTQFLQTAISIILSYFWQIISFQSSDDWRISTWICIFHWFSLLSKRQRRLDDWFALKKTNYWSRSFLFQTKLSRHKEVCCKLMQFILSLNYSVIFFDVSDHNRPCFFLEDPNYDTSFISSITQIRFIHV